MGFLAGLKGLVIEDDGTSTKAPSPVKPVAAVAPVGGVVPVATPTSGIPSYSPPMSSAVNPDMVATLRANTMSRKTPYTALVEAADRLATTIQDGVIPNAAAIRLKSAYAMIGDNRSISSIGNAIDLHIQDVQGEKMRFQQVTTKKRQADIDPLKIQATALGQQNDALTAEINAARARIEQIQTTLLTNNGKISDLTQQVQLKEGELQSVEAQFEASVGQVVAELEQQRNIITTTLN